MTALSDDSRHLKPAALPPPPDLSGHQRDALLLDFDGTLVDIAPRPDAITVPAGLPATLAALSEMLGGRLAIVSGRSIADLDRHLGPVPVAMAGSHGGEFREAGSGEARALVDPFPAQALTELAELAEDLGGLLVEEKPTGAAIHFRDAPDLEERVRSNVEAIAREHGIKVKHGKMVAELVVAGADKGAAVAHLMKLDRFAGSRPLFAGDDVTDEDAFRAVGAFGGGGVLVGPLRATAACWHLPDTAAVHIWLENALNEHA
ncbi:MAG: trehalose-phosphatase [Sphingomonadaceae bacterium]|jgi:trehalose 6-phosphate phosphatase